MNGLQAAENNLQADLGSIAIRKAAALQSKTVAEATQSAALLTKATAQGTYAVARRALDEAQNALNAAQDLGNRLPHFDWTKFLPHPGAWKVDGLTLIVNGRDFAVFSVNGTLMKGHSSWTGLFPSKSFSPDEQFVRNLRVNLNQQNTNFDEEIARFTTLGKDLDISGWMPGPISAAKAVGKLQYPPSDSKDGFATLDIELERVEARGNLTILDEKHGVRHKRYIRVEYRHRNPNGDNDERYKAWIPGTRLAVTGPVQWDTDRNGFFELHPVSSSQIAVLGTNDDGGSYI